MQLGTVIFYPEENGLGFTRVDRVTKNIGIEPWLFGKKPRQLSGGEKQKVAIGRAVVIEPEVFLLDEPLSNLDPQNRASALKEIVRLHRELKSTTLYVTHNIQEARVIADRLAVMKDGRFVQVDTTSKVFRQPVDDFVKDFIHSSDPAEWVI